MAEDPRSAQRVVNSTVHAFQTLNVQWARERSKRQAEFLEEQLAQTDSTLAKAQKALSDFRGRQQLASSQEMLEAQQAALVTLDAPSRELEADLNTFRGLQERLKGTDEASRTEALRALATSPAMADNPAVGGLYSNLLKYQQPHRLDDDRAVEGLGEQSGPGAGAGPWPPPPSSSWCRR